MTMGMVISKFKTYLSLTKPGIIRGNLMLATAGFLLASKSQIDWGNLATVLVSIMLIIASACVFNNFIDREIDKKMARTQKRALVNGLVSGRNALIYASILGLAGLIILAKYTNGLTFLAGTIGFVDYVVIYGLAKRRSTLSTLIGSISGAMPLVAGYLAVTNHFNAVVIVLFLIMVFWQMAHFFAIAIYRYDDYKAAGLPVLPVKKTIKSAKQQIISYIVAYDLSILYLGYSAKMSKIYFIVAGLMGLWWLVLGIKLWPNKDDQTWGKRMFLVSLVEITLFSILLSVDAFFK
ncbi:MAG TPA: heme o synthase [Candidatus Saccharimonadales bacterium]|nr:heme o synthase [Candidatus Saccharimonadales bacterium]